jgi:hypothetical protein
LIQDAAAKELSNDRYRNDGVHSTTPFNVLVFLAGTKAPLACIEAAKMQADFGDRPDGKWSSVYHWLFCKGWDEWISAGWALFALIVMFFGVANQIGAIPDWISIWNRTFSAGHSLCILFVATIFPVVMVVLGRRCVAWAKMQAEKMGRELAGTSAKMEAIADKIKETVQTIEPPAKD